MTEWKKQKCQTERVRDFNLQALCVCIHMNNCYECYIWVYMDR